VTAQHRLRGDVAVLVPAAGMGTRLGPGLPKALRMVGGRSLLTHAVTRVSGARGVACVVIAAPRGQAAEVASALSGSSAVELRVVEGGATRQESVAAALAAVPGCPIVLVHDAARAFAPPDLVERVADAVRAGHDAVIPVMPVVDTIKQVDADGGFVVSTPDRAVLRAVQTPQGFRRSVLERAHELASGSATDDSVLVERLGIRVFCVPGSPAALKITHPADLLAAERLLAPAAD
jgi:2-C-methyl-D-erythritol 4-phosphate cytidylyltransferase